MKKIVLFAMIIFIGLFLTSCDYPEKSFQVLDRDSIPKTVTRDFQLERGYYEPFIWTSDHEAIVIDGVNATVHQQDEDVVVYVTATINNKSETFQITVLKIGSPLTLREQAEDIAKHLNETYTKIDGGILQLPTEIDDIHIEYYLNDTQALYGYKTEDDHIWISSSFGAYGQEIQITVSFHDEFELLYSSELYLIAEGLSDDDPYLTALQESNSNNYLITNNQGYQLMLSNLKIGDIIAFDSHDSFSVLLLMNNEEYFQKIGINEYKIIKAFREDIFEIGRLTFTIDGLSKTIIVKMDM